MKKKHCDKVGREKCSLKERNVEGHFSVVFDDDTERTEHDTNWSEFSVEKKVGYGTGFKVVRVSNLPVKKITIKHNTLETTIEVPSGCEVYQAIRSRALLTLEGSTQKNFLVGRVVGLIKDDKVIEERFLNFLTNEITGFRL